ncbi:hypothetical protein [Metapseudomonas boanensis]|uniref:Uncharacterized protein n=1 Tax=Metapseudomonas boanensis TaxID=2822138 RepID=A0ABS5XNC2_9GAMM|nr:hypothetical protein [Pseudomonas boanensis]MBT8769165.1 hypothetical protein [Pseudomonas boanensis]
MERAIELAGFFAAHGIWCVSDGETLIPMLAQESAANGRSMLRFEAEQLEDGVAQAQAHFESNPDGADRATLVYDGYITLPTGRTDALCVVIRSYASPVATLTMAVPYRHAESPDGFAVHRPKFVEWQGGSNPDYQAFGEAFFRGVDSHREASAVWTEHNDDSV